jgi:hypothetical protein
MMETPLLLATTEFGRHLADRGDFGTVEVAVPLKVFSLLEAECDWLSRHRLTSPEEMAARAEPIEKRRLRIHTSAGFVEFRVRS